MFSSLRTVEFLKGKFELDNQNKNSFFFHLETIFIFFKLSDFFFTRHTKFLYAFDSHKLFDSCCKNVSCLYNLHSFVKN